MSAGTLVRACLVASLAIAAVGAAEAVHGQEPFENVEFGDLDLSVLMEVGAWQEAPAAPEVVAEPPAAAPEDPAPVMAPPALAHARPVELPAAGSGGADQTPAFAMIGVMGAAVALAGLALRRFGASRTFR